MNPEFLVDQNNGVPVLQHRVLLRAGRVVGRDVCDPPLPPDVVAALPVDVQRVAQRLACKGF